MDVCSHEGRQLDGLFVLTDITSFDQPTLSSAIVVVFKRYKYLNTASLEICHIKESDKQLLFSALHQSPSAKHDFLYLSLSKFDNLQSHPCYRYVRSQTLKLC